MEYHKMERLVRGFSNHRRIQILVLLEKSPELSVEEIAKITKTNTKTAADHIRRLAIAGLVLKRNEGTLVRQKLTLRAHKVLKFLRILE